MLKTIAVVAFTAALSIGTASVASATPGARVETGGRVTASSLLQDVHWEFRHHHRVWVPDHRRSYGHHGS